MDGWLGFGKESWEGDEKVTEASDGGKFAFVFLSWLELGAGALFLILFFWLSCGDAWDVGLCLCATGLED
jgi:hypothetical protein